MTAPLGSDNDDLLLRAVAALPPLAPPAPQSARIHARATAAFVSTAADRHRRLVRQAARGARILVPVSLAGMALGYLGWVCQRIADNWR